MTPEFADVDIFLISLDSLLIEFTAHKYHNWTMRTGQTIVLLEQFDRFLGLLADRGGKFKLIWFEAFQSLYDQDVVLNFLRAIVQKHLISVKNEDGSAKWTDKIEVFKSPTDEKWVQFLGRLTPSFLLASAEDPATEAFETFNGQFARRFVSLQLDVLSRNIPVVELLGFTVNISTVNAYRIGSKPIDFINIEVCFQVLRLLNSF